MSALIALFNTENDALVESGFVDTCIDLVNCLDEIGIGKINEYVTLLDNKQTKGSLEQEISESLIVVMEHNAALYGTFLYESTGEEIDPENAKTMLENIRIGFGREFVMEALSDKAKSRWKTAGKIGAGAAAVGVAGKLAYDHVKGNETEAANTDAGSRMAPSNSVKKAITANRDPGSRTQYTGEKGTGLQRLENDVKGAGNKVIGTVKGWGKSLNKQGEKPSI
jgi:hypothetical protein